MQAAPLTVSDERKEWLRAQLERIDRELAPHLFPPAGHPGPPDLRHPKRKLAVAMAAAGGKFVEVRP